MHSTLTSKGQLTFPKPLRSKLHINPGDRLQFVDNGDGTVTLFPITASVDDLFALGPKPKKPVTLEEMEQAVQTGATKCME